MKVLLKLTVGDYIHDGLDDFLDKLMVRISKLQSRLTIKQRKLVYNERKSKVKETNKQLEGELSKVTAIDSDGIGKRELSEELVKSADVKVADSRKQCLAFGELSCCSNDDDENPVVGLGQLLMNAGRTDNIRSGKSDDRITLFDSTGVAIQDVMIACGVLEAATAE